MNPPIPSRPTLDFRGGFDIETPEQVAFRLERAGLGSRLVAAVIDTIVLVFLHVAVLIAFFGIFPAVLAPESDTWLFLLGLLIVVLTFLFWGYYIGFEAAWNGQTPGKRALGIRVVGDGGVPVTFGMVVIRNLLRVIDAQLGYVIGMISIFVTKEEKRLGDLAAGTVVVSERRRAPGRTAFGREPSPAGRHVDPRLLELVTDFWARSAELDPRTRVRIGHEIANRLAESLGRPAVPANRVEAELDEMSRIVFSGS